MFCFQFDYLVYSSFLKTGKLLNCRASDKKNKNNNNKKYILILIGTTHMSYLPTVIVKMM